MINRIKPRNLLPFLIVLCLVSCAKVYYSEDARYLAHIQHTIAILPPTVSISASKKVEAEALKEQQRTESYNFQQEIYAWLLKRKMKRQIIQEIQDVEKTNILLKRAGYPDSLLTKGEICQLLGVDGIISSNFALSKPLSQGAAIATAVLFGVSGSTNEVRVSMSIHDCSKTKLIWKFDHQFSGGLGSSPSRLVDNLMAMASKSMPYTKNYNRNGF